MAGPALPLDRVMLDARFGEFMAIVEAATREELPGLIGQLEAAKATAWQRINAGPSVKNDVAAAVHEWWIRLAQVSPLPNAAGTSPPSTISSLATIILLV